MEYLVHEKLDRFGFKEKTLELLSLLNIHTLFDLLYFFPREYENFHDTKLDDLQADQLVCVKVTILKTNIIKAKGKSVFKASIENSPLEVVWFQMPYLRNTIKAGMEIYIRGKVINNYGLKIVNPEYSLVKKDNAINPIYSLTQSLKQSALKKIIHGAISFSRLFQEIIPKEIVEKYRIMDRSRALKEIHMPSSEKALEDAKRRFLIEELLVLQFAIYKRRHEITLGSKYVLDDNRALVKQYLSTLPFTLTNAQKRVITEIHRELKEGKLVNRLIQGDVGSGKTIVAIILLLYIISNNYQGVLMAPTEVVAEQHYLSLKDLMKELNVNVRILTGKIKKKEKDEILKDLVEGRVDLLVGTHALIYDKVIFKNLGLIVIDEQHKFGVQQRKALRDKGMLANLITMSATPIPRSLALTLYGDLDISIIDELPPHRREIRTKIVFTNKLKELYESIKYSLNKGEQCYIVCPLIEESEKLEAHAAETIYLHLKDEVFKEYSVGLLHGKLASKEKEEVINKFKKNEIQVLVSTTVIEVGVDVPNATTMVILNSDRFGLAQLHQIRGRVGRGNIQSNCYLVADYITDKLKILERSLDGFEIAEEDLKLRQAGDILGIKQSGGANFKFLDLLKDIKSIALARKEVNEYYSKHNTISPILEQEIFKRFEEKSDLN